MCDWRRRRASHQPRNLVRRPVLGPARSSDALIQNRSHGDRIRGGRRHGRHRALALRSTFSATDPISTRSNPWRPCVPITMEDCRPGRSAVLVGPDAEGAQWVTNVADRVGAPSVVMQKTRRSDRVVTVAAPDMADYRQYTPVVDDVVSSVETMTETVKVLSGTDCHDHGRTALHQCHRCHSALDPGYSRPHGLTLAFRDRGSGPVSRA